MEEGKDFYKYFTEECDLHNSILDYIEQENDDKSFPAELVKIFEFTKNQPKRYDLMKILHILVAISNNHHRYSNFNQKIEQVLIYFKNEIKQLFSNEELYDIFKSNKRILLFFIEENIIILNKKIIEDFYKSKMLYFAPEIKTFNETNHEFKIKTEEIEDLLNNVEIFEQNRHEGENEDYICQIIRNDSVDEFISYVNKCDISLSINIKPSIFETNEYLLHKNPNLIEYSVFFGSIQIFKYLKLNNVEVSPTLWMYAIHGRNTEIIHYLEENNILPPEKSYKNCFIESIKCHHNELAYYIQDNLLSHEEYEQLQNDHQNRLIDYIFQFHNYGYVNDDLNHHLFFCYLCKNNFMKVVLLLIENKCIDFDIKEKIVPFLLILYKVQIIIFLCN